MAKKKKAGAAIEPRLRDFVAMLPVHANTKASHVHVDLSGPGGGAWSIECKAEGAALVTERAQHHVRIRGEAKALLPLLKLKLEPAEAYVRGGLLIEGDIAHIDQLVELATRAVRANRKRRD
jgi:hypothetical protein